MKNHYQILGVKPDCSQADVKKAYRQLALKYHPDKNSGNKQSEEYFKEILESYIILSDIATRSEYDYIKGYKTSYRTLGSEPGKPSPIKFLIQFKKIKEAVLNANGHINKNALFMVINNLLSDENISFLIKERDISINHLIIDELITSSIFLERIHKEEIYIKLIKLAESNTGMINRITLLNKPSDTITTIDTNKKTESIETPTPKGAIFIFVLIALLLLLLLMINR